MSLLPLWARLFSVRPWASVGIQFHKHAFGSVRLHLEVRQKPLCRWVASLVLAILYKEIPNLLVKRLSQHRVSSAFAKFKLYVEKCWNQHSKEVLY